MTSTVKHTPDVVAGYKAFNGYIFTGADADYYNRACSCPMTTEDQKHNVYMLIIMGNEGDDNAT